MNRRGRLLIAAALATLIVSVPAARGAMAVSVQSDPGDEEVEDLDEEPELEEQFDDADDDEEIVDDFEPADDDGGEVLDDPAGTSSDDDPFESEPDDPAADSDASDEDSSTGLDGEDSDDGVSGEDDADEGSAEDHEAGDRPSETDTQSDEEKELDAPAGVSGSDEEFLVELDVDGEEVVAGEILALTTEKGAVEELRSHGYTVTNVESLRGLGMELVTIVDARDRNPLTTIQGRTDKAIFARNHLFPAGSEPTASRVHGQAVKRHRSPRGVVGLIDGGVETARLRDLVELRSADFGKGRSRASSHGSAVALLLARHGVRKIYSANIFSGRRASALSLVRALDWMALNDVPVVNISLAGPPNPIVAQAIRALSARGVAIVAAVGNNGPAAKPRYPAAYPEVIGVTAVDTGHAVYVRAIQGPQVQFAAKGVGIALVDRTGLSRVVTGTSFAAPLVASRFARKLLRPDRRLRSGILNESIRRAKDLGPPGRDPIYGYGLIQP